MKILEIQYLQNLSVEVTELETVTMDTMEA